MADQLRVWEGEFGTAYTDRNVVDWRVRLPVFRLIVTGLPINRVLEVGCNRGHNLLAIRELLGESSEVVGVEPNRKAAGLARASSQDIGVLYGHAGDLPFRDDYFDLVFTAGVLIHIPNAGLPAAVREIHRVSRRYILAIEYFAGEETAVPYRGHDDLLWKRDFVRHYRDMFPELVVIRDGRCGAEHGFDDVHWWLMEKLQQGRET